MQTLELKRKAPVKNGVKAEPKTYTFKEALKASTEYFNGDELAANVWVNKYALKDSSGNIYEQTPDDMHRRIASELHRVEAKYPNPVSEERLFELLRNFKYIIPQGSPMSGIGNNYQVSSLSNCFVIGSGADSYGGIIRADEEQVQLMKRRGGVGHDLSHIRPKGSPVLNSALSSTGLVPFMERYSNSTREVAQDGRRGALMLSVSIKHPDAEDFIDAKMESGKVTGANVSVRLDDDFMKAAIAGSEYIQKFPINSNEPTYQKSIDASKLWDKIIHNAWKSAEPGVLFWDTIIRESVPDCYADLGYRTVSTNPCGEIPLCPYDSCRLLAINLFGYVDNPFTTKAKFNFEKFADHVQMAQRMMDDIIDLEIEKIEKIIEKIENDPEAEDIKATELRLWQKIRRTCVEGRRTGVGITAEGDMLAALGLKYGTDEALDCSVEVHKTLAVNAYGSSVTMAKERGAFAIYHAAREAKNPFINRLKEADPKMYEDMVKYGRRNIALLTIAPTGTTSLMSQTTSGIEPAFLITYKRRRKVNPNDKEVTVSFVDEVGDHWEEYNVFHHKFLDWLTANGHDITDIKHMSSEDLNKLVAKSPYYKATANDVDWVQKVKMQGAIQKWVDHSISVTVNVPFETSADMVKQIYQTAWETGCKGCTIYRDGSRSGVLVSNDDTGKKQEDKQTEDDGTQIPTTSAPKRPKRLETEIVRFQNNHEKWMAFVGLLDGQPYEIFTGRAEDIFMLPPWVTSGWVIKEKDDEGNNRYDFQFADKDGYKVTMEGLSRSFDKEYWNYAKLISGALRHGMPLPYVINMVAGLNVEQEHINTWKTGVVRALKKFVPDGTYAIKESCPQCGDKDGLIYKEGCLICKSCGHSKCG
ncbi:MAG: adenosylcobalamin-dependent ribonucleoside-diphosphate reductase [Saprospiraceae bacterium]|nr:adenosylcobalamin-dependent ribonucleoside-diphosphate reductase [Saprospiraceae bacterium]MCF8249680.1 adenosylcobalamin-dependent ribonucleoside-diphosphate reductase [Saprospiraceae bacterium]MCF8279839.1 adenosylcobalamin-dependent ribonucleoside-diphosphate reductase [Bacteroidales bacterium]MCF8312333.1 adenosylcobalamin-dependent ribonucleoside-diphosphate reductase [Saprospiraceae bacterium]MCF8440670.1 adenosylcobalamin-dependent ribonucleoside-diphosphate reductase [Saprospiraceae 